MYGLPALRAGMFRDADGCLPAGEVGHPCRPSRSAHKLCAVHGFPAFASAEHYRPAEQDRVETVEHDRRRDQKLLDAQGEDEIRSRSGFEDQAQALDFVAEADCVPEPGRTLPAIVHPGQPGLIVASHEIPGEKEAERTGQRIRNDERQPNSGGDERLADQVQPRIAAECYERNRQADRKQHEPGQKSMRRQRTIPTSASSSGEYWWPGVLVTRRPGTGGARRSR